MKNKRTSEIFIEIESKQAATIKGGNAFLQVRGLISGIFNGGYRNFGLGALAGQSIALFGGVQRVPLYLIFRR